MVSEGIENLKSEQHGVYYIVEKTTNRIYVGSSVNIKRRVKQHYSDLIGNLHKNSYLQRTWNKYGELSFVSGVLELVDRKENLLSSEQYWIDFFESASREDGFNLSPTAGSNLGFKKTKEQIENSILAIRGTKNTILTEDGASQVKFMLNKDYSITYIAKLMEVDYETIRSIRRGNSFLYVNPQIKHNNNMKAKLTESDVIEIKKLLNTGERVKEISIDYSVSHRTISAIKNEISWKHIGDKIIIPMRKKRSASSI